MNVWRERAEQSPKDSVDSLRQVLDPLDFKGLKNLYIDYYFKYYICKHLRPNPVDVLFEIGCGRGRLSEYLASFVSHVYGVDLIDHFIAICKENPQKKPNTTYFNLSDLHPLEDVNKCFTVGVLMYFENDESLIQTLKTYQSFLPHAGSFYFLEQCEQQTKNKTLEGDFYARYRTVKDYRRLFAKAGLRISRLTVMGERTYGPCLNALLRYNFVYQRLPKALHRIIPGLFHIDRFLLSLGRRRILDAAPTDVLFQLEKV